AHLWQRVEADGADFPLTVTMKRIAPAEKNTWTLRAVWLQGGVEYSTKNPKQVRLMSLHTLPDGTREQAWSAIEAGSQSVWPTVTGGIFETGFSDAILQMWASFLAERAGLLGDGFGCVTPEEALNTHSIYEAAQRSHQSGEVA